MLLCDLMESSTNRWYKEGIRLRSTSFSSIEHMNTFAMSGPSDKAFEKEWFNWKYNLKLEKFELVELLKLAVKHQLFEIDGKLYEQVDGVAMGSPLGQIMANVFVCSIEEKLVERNLMPSLYHRFVDDSITSQSNIASAEAFLFTLNSLHPSLQFTMKLEIDGSITFHGHYTN
jgi:hypothetical protein